MARGERALEKCKRPKDESDHSQRKSDEALKVKVGLQNGDLPGMSPSRGGLRQKQLRRNVNLSALIQYNLEMGQMTLQTNHTWMLTRRNTNRRRKNTFLTLKPEKMLN